MSSGTEVVRSHVALRLGIAAIATVISVSSVVVLGPWSWGPVVTGETLSVIAGVLACASSGYAFSRSKGALRWSWLLITTMCLLYSSADILWLVFADAAPTSPVLTVADSLYLVGLVPAVAGLVAYPTARGIGRTWLPLTLDGVVLGSSALLVSYLLALAEVENSTTGFETFVYVVFPITSVLLASLVLLLLVRSVGAVRPDVVLLGLAFATFAVGDIGFALSTVRGDSIQGTIFQVAYVAAPLMLVMAALMASTFDTSTRVLQRHLSDPIAQLLPDFAAFAALALCFIVGVSGGVEVGLIAAVLVLTGLREMTVTAQNLRLRHDLEQRIAERTEDLLLLTAEHRRLDSMKQHFVSAVSHELRTPLTAIRGSLEMLSDGEVGELPLRAQPVVAIASRGSERLSRLVNDIIDLERLESGSFGFHPAPCELYPVLKDAADSLASLSSAAGVSVLVSPVAAQVDCDVDRVTQALVNLIGNALKFTAPGGTVLVAAEMAAEDVQVSVTDTGRGIPEAELAAIFEPFHQIDPDQVRQNPGTGLGLAITQGIVQAHGGRIWAESVPGKGSTFHFTLPLGPSLEQVATGADSDEGERQGAQSDPRPSQLTA